MKIYHYEIVLQEVPGEISLAFAVKGCQNKCKQCSYESLSSSHDLTISLYINLLNRYKNMITCVLFLGGDWNTELETYLKLAKANKVKTCLYTGLDSIPENIKQNLDYLKVGKYIPELGGLQSEKTNQKFIHIPTGRDDTYKFKRIGVIQ